MQRTPLGSLLLSAALVGCASVLGLEERELAPAAEDGTDAGNASSSGKTSASSSSGASSSTSTSSSSSSGISSSSGGDPDASNVDACAAATRTVYELTNGTGDNTAYRYELSPADIDNFTGGHAVFRLVPNQTVDTKPLYSLKDTADGDFLVSPLPDEGGFSELGRLGFAFQDDIPGQTVSSFRLMHGTPLRHRQSPVKDLGAPWTDDLKEYHVCPP